MSRTTHPIEQELDRIADEIRVRIHLAGMDAKDAWHKLEPKLHEFRRQAQDATARMTGELVKLGDDLRDQLGRLRDRMGKDAAEPPK